MKSLVKIIPVTNFKEFVPNAACDPEHCLESWPLMYAKENRASRNFIFIFLLIKADKKIKNMCRKSRFNFKGIKKISWPLQKSPFSCDNALH